MLIPFVTFYLIELYVIVITKLSTYNSVVLSIVLLKTRYKIIRTNI